MPQRRAPAVSNSSGISAKEFCWACVFFLGTVLVLQICLLVSLLGRLAEVQQAAGEPTTAAATEATEPAGPSPENTAVPAREASMDFLAVASAVGADQDAMRLFIRSYQRATPSQLVLLVEQMPLESDLRDSGIDLARLRLERVLPLPSTWSSLTREDAHIYFLHQYLQRMPHVKMLQLSDVDDIVFQADPFVWASEQEAGLHLFLDEPGVVVNSGKMWKVLELCYGTQAARLHAKPRIPAGYMIGSSADVQQFLSDLLDEVSGRTACHKPGVVNAIANYMAHAAHAGVSLHLHDNRKGPVWSGEHVPGKAFVLDAESHVINDDGYQYAVLRSYRSHDELWRSIMQQFGKQDVPMDAGMPDTCAAFHIEDGDMPGHDLTHTPKDSEAGCCAACASSAGCGAFTFSPSRKHCWLKKPGGAKKRNPASDMRCGVRSDAVQGLPPSGVV